MDKDRGKGLSIAFFALVWFTLLGLIAYQTLGIVDKAAEDMKINFKTLREMMDGNS